MSSPNLSYLRSEWLDRGPAARALKAIPKMSVSERQQLFRHHDDTDDGIADAETYSRDDLDYLLGFYGILEIGLMTGFVESLPADFKATHLGILCDPAVRRYYEYNYPLELPRRLRDRMQAGVSYRGNGSEETIESYYRFLELTKAMDADEDMEAFLWCLEAGERRDAGGWCDIDRVVSLLGKPKRIAKAWSMDDTVDYQIHRAIRGFWKFVQFCENLAQLLESLREDPQVAEAMWHVHAYWFRQLELAMGDEVKAGIRAMTEWEVGTQEKEAVQARVAELEAVLDLLATPPLARWQLAPVADQPAAAQVATVMEILKATLEDIRKEEVEKTGATFIDSDLIIPVKAAGQKQAAAAVVVFDQQGNVLWKPQMAKLLSKKFAYQLFKHSGTVIKTFGPWSK